jgi:hypothetical protein
MRFKTDICLDTLARPGDPDVLSETSPDVRRSCTLSVFQVRLIVLRMYLFGVKMSVYSKCDWFLHDSCILTQLNVSMSRVRSHIVRRVFHIPLVIVLPI